MAFDPTKLYLVIGSAPGFNVYRYTSAVDDLATIETAGYMTSSGSNSTLTATGRANPTGIAPKLTVNDVVIVTGTDGSDQCVVSAVSGTTSAATLTTFT